MQTRLYSATSGIRLEINKKKRSTQVFLILAPTRNPTLNNHCDLIEEIVDNFWKKMT